MRVLIIIPIYNEEKNIVQVLDEINQFCPQYDVLVIDDGSTDHSNKACRSSNKTSVINLSANLGIGGARQTGFKYAYYHNYDVVIQLDGDGQHNIEYITKMLDQIKGGYNICIGSRFIDFDGFQSSFMRRAGILFINNLIKLVTGKSITDPTSGFRVCDKTAIKLFARDYPLDFPEPESIVSASKNKLKICEVAVQMNERKSGKSSIGKLSSVYFIIKVTIAMLIASISNP